ncbi:MAG TPA: HAMP domain-containing sensor histidine kinase [Polyangiaceae bacterium]|nr:HAMP domain-containing sensor histidine kinase [Polyangiaceae bacterium]
MLSEFLIEHRDELVARCRARVAKRLAPRPTGLELEHGVPLFLDRLAESLRSRRCSGGATGAADAEHGGDLLRHGFTVAQVVHDYGDVCQAITELAIERRVPIATEDFRALNHCLDNAIADAVTEYGRQREIDLSALNAQRETERMGSLAHELRNLLNNATLAFEALREGGVGVQGNTSAVLGRSLVRLRDLVDRSLAEVRLSAGLERRERVALAPFVEEVEITAVMEAKGRGHELSIEPVAPGLAVEADRHLLASVVGNLLQNAFKYTRPRTRVRLSVRASGERVLIDVEDECGGLPPGKQDELFAPFSQGSADRTGLGLGLAISLRAVRTLGGELSVRDLPGKGCVFTVDLPRSPP